MSLKNGKFRCIEDRKFVRHRMLTILAGLVCQLAAVSWGEKVTMSCQSAGDVRNVALNKQRDQAYPSTCITHPLPWLYLDSG